jgi:hypothetical protein
MEVTSNITGKMHRVALWLSSLGTFIAGLNYLWVHLPTWVTAVGGTMVGFAVCINSIYGGKNPDGSAKTPTQVRHQNQLAADTKVLKK